VVEQELAGHGVDVRLQRRGDTGMIVVLIDRGGECTIFPSRGASGLLEFIRQATGDASLNSNVALYRNNARLAAQIAVALEATTGST